MENEIRDIIKKNLPAEVGDVLKERLDQAERDKNDLESCEEIISDRNTKIASLENEIKRYKEMDALYDSITNRDIAVSERERNMKVWEAEHKAASSEARATELSSLVQIVFRSPVYKQHIYGSTPIPYHSGGGTLTQPFNKTTTNSEE